MYQGMIFDLDGTLISTVEDVEASANRMLTRMGYPTVSRQVILHNISFTTPDFLRGILPPEAHTEALLAEAERLYEEAYAEQYQVFSHPFDGLCEVVAQLAARGMPLAVLSNKYHPYTVALIEKLFPAGAFSLVWGLQAQFPKKPDPTSALAIAAEWGVDPAEIALVGDSIIDVCTAVAAGMHAVAVTWGYGNHADMAAAGAERFIDRPEELL